MHKIEMIYTLNRYSEPSATQYVWKYFFKRPFIGHATSSPFKFCKTKVLFPKILTTVKGPIHRLSNFPCLPLSSFHASHLRTRSPTAKTSFLIFLSKPSFTFFPVHLSCIHNGFSFLLQLDYLKHSSSYIIRFLFYFLQKLNYWGS